MRFLDLFAGIGGFRLAMEKAGHECVGYVEWDKFARKSYEAMYDTKGEFTAHDITKVTDEEWRNLRESVDIICGGFPCQAFSVAGKRLGFNETRGTLFFEIARAAKQIKPRFLLLENVKGLLSHDKGETFRAILSTLDELGYDAEWQVLNSKDFGVPQNRERVFVVGHLRGSGGGKVFPIRGNDSETDAKLKPVINSKSQVDRVYDPSGLCPTLTTMQGGRQEPKILVPRTKKEDGQRRVEYSISDVVPTILASQHKSGDQQPKIVLPVLTPDCTEKRQNGRRFKTDGEPMFTLTTQDRHGVAILQRPRGHNKGGLHEVSPTITSNDWHQNNHVIIGGLQKNAAVNKDGICPTLTQAMGSGGGHIPIHNYDYKIRKLTPRECWRLQAFPDELFDKAQAVNSNSQLYKQAGNSVTVSVVYEIAKRLKEMGDSE